MSVVHDSAAPVAHSVTALDIDLNPVASASDCQHHMGAGRVSTAPALERHACDDFWVQPMACRPSAGEGSGAGHRDAGRSHDGATWPLRRD